ncbi:hypothetical protein K470DRAFT_257169 [Piedraia hortae CBS 480.64]|uniref:MARVEL domain-containing protein n=1 Tax=Piedraia hortae CBS 480.64 TaxID=1314780 RepID=A0A6A7C171_9PEZI|nr:hypothetical protein K470DRAFT_257169 [Piedraia hortae CBS 480.64]
MPALDARIIVLALRLAQALLALITLGLSGYVIHWWTHYWHIGSPSSANFLLFTSLWTLLAILALILIPWRLSATKLNHKFAILGIETVTMIFWFAGFVALAVFLSDRVCYGPVCGAAKALAVFGGFEWVIFAATTAMAVMHALRTREPKGSHGPVNANSNMMGDAPMGSGMGV